MFLVDATLENPVEIATSKQKCRLQAYNVPINVHRCMKTTVVVNSCIGACLSIHCPRDADDLSGYVRFHNYSYCCHVTEVVNVTVELKCYDHYDEYYMSHLLQSATSCDCQKCRI